VLGGIDQLVHGGALRGWGTQAAPDPVLLVPRGFDAAGPGGPRFRYDVNPRFADTRGRSTLFREPFRISMDFSSTSPWTTRCSSSGAPPSRCA
jgi:hypothetical protein